MKLHVKILIFLTGLNLLFLLTNAYAKNAVVEYKTKTDRLSVHAENQPLRTVLTQIAYRTGLEILFDESINKNVTVTVTNLPLEKALKNIVRKTNHVFYYKSDPKTKKQLLVGLKVLPAGKQDESLLRPLLSKKGDFYLMRKTKTDLKEASETNTAYIRRMVRYNDLDAKQRNEVDKELDKIEEQIAKNKAKREERYEATRAKSKPEPGTDPRSRDEIMKEENPVFYDRMMERRREIEARIIEQESQ